MRKIQHIKNCFFQVEELEKIKLENAWNSSTVNQNVKRSLVKIDCRKWEREKGCNTTSVVSGVQIKLERLSWHI
jgi:hypothetical protein